MYNYNTLYGLYSPQKKPFLFNTDIHPLYGKKKIGGRVKDALPTPSPMLDIEKVNNNNVVPLLGTLATILLPTITSIIFNKFIKKKGKKHIDNLNINNIVEEIISEDNNKSDKIDNETRSLLNRIIGKGIMEL